MTIKIVVNAKHGGFTLSPAAILEMIETMPEMIESFPVNHGEVDQSRVKPMSKPGYFEDWTGVVIDGDKNVGYVVVNSAWSCQPDFQITFRTNPALVEIVERLGDAANGPYSKLKVITIEDEDITIDKLEIIENNGFEYVREKARSWS
jgi:hypothetical protein